MSEASATCGAVRGRRGLLGYGRSFWLVFWSTFALNSSSNLFVLYPLQLVHFGAASGWCSGPRSRSTPRATCSFSILCNWSISAQLLAGVLVHVRAQLLEQPVRSLSSAIGPFRR